MRLSRRTSFIIILIVASLLIGGLIGFYFYTKTKNAPAPFLGQTTTGKVSFGDYNPDRTGTTTPPVDSITGSTRTEEAKIPKLRKISGTPTAGSAFVFLDIIATTTKALNVEPPDSPNPKAAAKVAPRVIGSKEVIRFMERGTGHIYETGTSTDKNERISNTTIPKIYEAYFLNKGDSLILRDLIGSTDIIRTQYARLDYASTTDTEKSLTFSSLPVGATQIAISPLKTRIFSIFNSGTTGLISQADGGSKVGMFTSAFKEWLVSWPTEQTAILTTKPSGFAPGYVYSLDTRTKNFSRIFGGINGLTVLPSPDATRFLFSESGAGSFKMKLFTKKDSSIKDLRVNTFPEKCVWANTEADVVYCAVPDNVSFDTYPDVWYQGLITFSDSIWKINVATGETRILVIPQNESGEIIDAINPAIDSKDDYLIFTNKIDLSLWGYQLKEPMVISPTSSIFGLPVSTSTSGN